MCGGGCPVGAGRLLVQEPWCRRRMVVCWLCGERSVGRGCERQWLVLVLGALHCLGHIPAAVWLLLLLQRSSKHGGSMEGAGWRLGFQHLSRCAVVSWPGPACCLCCIHASSSCSSCKLM